MRSRRASILVVLAALAGAAVLAGNGREPARPGALPVPAAASLLGPTAAAGTWFCPGLPPAVPAADQWVTFTNFGSGRADVVVTARPDKRGEPGAGSGPGEARSALTIGPRAVERRPRAELGAPGALTAEVFGGQVVVEEGVDATAGTDVSPCANQSATRWNFAAGTTRRGVEQWLVIDDPYATDAKVDIALRTADGLRRLGSLEGYDVPRRSRVVLALHDLAVLQDELAVEVVARSGRVVAAQTLVYTSQSAAPGIAHTIGGTATSPDWYFAEGANAPQSDGWVALANVGTIDTQVDVQAILESNQLALPASIAVAQDEVAWVRLGGCSSAGATAECVAVPPNARYSLEVHADHDVAIVAQVLLRATGSGARGTTTALGVAAPARRWLFGAGLAGARATALAFMNPGATPARVGLSLVRGGRVERPGRLQGILVRPGRRVTVVVPNGTPIVVEADGRVVVERLASGPNGASRSVGIAG